ncbi:MAG: AAA family ATPase [Sphaerochaetaceae bacterium]|nr:AAA family ATPase [Sphaerochaetaceae bacterium]
MISFIKLNNFKSFKNVELDLRGKKGIPKKMAFIYGENGSGKTNLMDSLFFLHNSFNTLMNINLLTNIENKDLSNVIEENKYSKDDLISFIKKIANRPLDALLDENKMIGSKDPMQIEIGFYLHEKEGRYLVEFNDLKVIKESLFFTIRERVGEMFSISENSINLNDSVFVDRKYKNELLENVEKYWGKHTFMSILFNERKVKNKEYINEKLNPNLIHTMKLLNRCTVICKNNNSQKGYFAIPYSLLNNLKEGIFTEEIKKELPVFEHFLNIFFTQLYSDIKKVFYKKTVTEGNKERYELYLSKEMYNQVIDIPFKLESTGTQKLLEVVPAIISSLLGESVFIDEIDSGIHDQLMFEIVNLFKEALLDTETGQFIATTHNTLLLKQLEPENIYIIVIDSYGNKEIQNLSDYSFRTQKNNNIQNKYLNGDYFGLPTVGYLDFTEMIEDLSTSLKPEKEFSV